MSEFFNKSIKKWLDGDFRRSDEDALRQSAKDDAFVRDAMDGFYGLPEEDHAKRLASLRKKIRGGADVPMQAEKTKPKWWAMAAALVFLLGAVWFMQTNNFNENKTISEAAKPIKPEVTEAPAVADFSEEKNTTQKENQTSATQNTAASAEAKMEQAAPSTAQQKEQKPTPKPQNTTTTPPKTNKTRAIATAPTPANTNAEPTGKVAETRAPSPPPSDENIEEAGNMVSEDVSVEKTEAAIPKKDKPASATAKKKAKEAVADEATTFETDRELADFADSIYNADAYAPALPEEPEPLMGWDDFRRYLRINARLTEEALNNNISGTVRLRFSLNQRGEPINIIVIKSLGYGCDEEAIRLIEEGGDWQVAENNRVYVDVQFRR